MNNFIHIEREHARWLLQYEVFFQSFLKNQFGPGVSKAAIIRFSDEKDEEYNEYIYESLGTISLPLGSDKLILTMARFCMAGLCYEPIKNLSIEEFDVGTFCLHSLLQSSFPRNVKTNIFKGTEGGILASMLYGDLTEEEVLHGAFAGLGVILMEKVRLLMCPLSTDSDVLEATLGYYLTFLK